MKGIRISGKKIEEMFEDVARWGRIVGYEDSSTELRAMYEAQYFGACMLLNALGLVNEFHEYEWKQKESRD